MQRWEGTPRCKRGKAAVNEGINIIALQGRGRPQCRVYAAVRVGGTLQCRVYTQVQGVHPGTGSTRQCATVGFSGLATLI